MVSVPGMQLVAIALVAAVTGCNAPSGAKRVEEQKQTGPSMSNPEQPAAALERLVVAPLLTVPVSRVAPARIVDVTPPAGASRIELPGPSTRPVRPHLEPTASPAGVAARVVQGDGTAVPRVVLGDDARIIPVTDEPLAVSARTDGVWVMYRDRLVHHAPDGAPVRTVGVSGVALAGGADDAVWVASQDAAWRVDRQGDVHGPWSWAGGLTSFAAGIDLCARDKREPGILRCLSATGESQERALPDALLPLEQPLSLDQDRAITLQGTRLRVRRGAAIHLTITLLAAGLDASGRAFLLAATDQETALWHQDGTRRRLPPGSPGSATAAAVDGDVVRIYGLGRVTTYRDAAAGESAIVDEQAYRDQIFPRMWQLAPVRAVAVRADGVLVVSATGPDGMVLLTIRLA